MLGMLGGLSLPRKWHVRSMAVGLVPTGLCLRYHQFICCRLGGDWVRQCAVGLSGVVFGLIVADNAASRATHRSIFGCGALLNTRQRTTTPAAAAYGGGVAALLTSRGAYGAVQASCACDHQAALQARQHKKSNTIKHYKI